MRRISKLLWAGCVAFGLSMPTAAGAQSAYPSKPIRIIVPFGPGGFADLTLRIVAEKLGERTGHRPIIDNRPSGGGIAAAQAAAAAPADGHTLIVLANGTAISVSLFKALPFDPVKDFVPISTVAFYDLLLLVNGTSPIKTIPDLIADAKKRGTVNFGATNPGSTASLSAELFKMVTGLKATVVPYRNSPEVQIALQRDDIMLGFETYGALRGGVQGGQIRAVASTGPVRLLKDVPTVRESGIPDYEVYGWNSLFAPAGTPPEIVAFLSKEIREILALPDVQKRITDLGGEPKASTPTEMAERLQSDIKKWAIVIDKAGIEKR